MIHESEKFFFSAFVLPQKSINFRNFLSAGRYRDRERERLVKRMKDIICKERDRVGEGERDRERKRERERHREREVEKNIRRILMRTHRDKVRRKSIAHKTNEILGKRGKGISW